MAMVANGGDGLWIWAVPTNILNNLSQLDDKGCSDSLWGSAGGLKTLTTKSSHVNSYTGLYNCTDSLK
jgi:hypothetical protein